MGIPRIDDATGTVDGVNRYFYVPNPYVPGTLVVMINGRQRDDDLENGWIERDPAAGLFEMRQAPRPPQGASDDPGDLVSAYYDNADETAGGGSGGGVPSIRAGQDLKPKICQTSDIVPGLEAVGEGEQVPSVGAVELRPKVCQTLDIRPRIARVEEI